MTLEQLDKIEATAEKYGDVSRVLIPILKLSLRETLQERDDANAEIERLQAMLKDAILERDETLKDLSTSQRANGRIIKERDAALAYKDQWQRAAEEERAKVRAEFEAWKKDHLNHEADDLRAERDAALSELRMTKAFYDVTVKERDYERLQAKLLEDAARMYDMGQRGLDLIAERDEARKWLEAICEEFEATISHADWVRGGSRGMSLTFTGDFANVVQLPSVISRMRWWAREFRAVLNGDKP